MIINRYKRIGCNINVMQHTACLEFNQGLVKCFAFLFSCTLLVHDDPDLELSCRRDCPDYEFGKRAKTHVSGRIHRDLNISVLLLQYSSDFITVDVT